MSLPLQGMLGILVSCGWKRAWKVALNFPAIILTPVFSFWTFGDKKGGYFCKTQTNRKIQLSFTLSWINFSLSVIANTGLLINNLTKASFLGHSIFHIISCSCLVFSGSVCMSILLEFCFLILITTYFLLSAFLEIS